MGWESYGRIWKNTEIAIQIYPRGYNLPYNTNNSYDNIILWYEWIFNPIQTRNPLCRKVLRAASSLLYIRRKKGCGIPIPLHYPIDQIPINFHKLPTFAIIMLLFTIKLLSFTNICTKMLSNASIIYHYTITLTPSIFIVYQ